MSDRVEALYAEQVGAEALDRQRGDGRERHHCCGEPISVGLHPVCAKRSEDDPASHVDGQESLI